MTDATENPLLKRLGGISRKAINKTRSLLSGGARDDQSQASTSQLTTNPLVVPSGDHPVTPKTLSRAAVKVLTKLDEAGYAAYLVGGGVRDALVGLRPKDFDIATDASPEDVRALFRNSRIIGRRFRLVHVVFGREIIEVATFRAAHDKGAGGEVGASGRIVRDNVFGSIEEDAMRRDFSVNALYYNIADHSVVDYVGGLVDIDAGVFRLIGDPLTRCEEDPVRVLRAVRLAAKLEFSIQADTLAAMRKTAVELQHTPPARLFEEVLKLFQGGYALRSFAAVVDNDLLQYLFPLLDERLKAGDEPLRHMLDEALENTDRRVASGKPITPAYLLAFMLWPDVEHDTNQEVARGTSLHDALYTAGESVLSTQVKVTSIPRRFSGPMKEIWQMQPRLEQWRGARALKLIAERRFRAAYDFLCLRASQNPELEPLAAWWTKVQTLTEDDRVVAANDKPLVHCWGQGAAADAPEGDDSATADRQGSAKKAPAKRRRRRRRRKPGGDKSNRPGPAS
ncbi:MAG: polynucleotide adenylyltransferase PcnB [Granulosicoccus sp.]